jgi:subtilisin family serine protease
MTRVRLVSLCAAAASVALPAVPASASNDTSFSQQWNLSRIGAPEAWTHTTGQGIRIGIVDTGIDLNHEDLAGKVVAHTSCVGSKGDPAKCSGSAQDDHGHGTHVAGIASAWKDNGKGIAGVAPDAELVVVKALNADGSGTVEDINAGLKWLVDNGADVVNLSLGGNFLVTSLTGNSMAEGIEYAWAHGVVPVVASGNTNLGGLGLIGSSQYGDMNAIVVGATGPADEIAEYSSPQGNAKWSVYAPGGLGDKVAEHNILSSVWVKDKQNQYASFAGTSMATPHVAGAVALLLAEGYTQRGAVDRLLSTANRAVSGGGLLGGASGGRIDLAAATAK